MSDKIEEIAGLATREPPFPVPGENWEARTPSERLKFAVRQAGGPKVIAERSQVPLTTLGTYTRGGEMKLSNLRQLADATGVTVEWLATGRGPMRPGEAPAGPPPEPAKPQETAPSGPLLLFPNVNMDRLADALGAAQAFFAKAGRQPDPRALAQAMCLLYDEVTKAEPL